MINERLVNFYRGYLPISEDITPALKIWTNAIALKADTWKSCTNFCSYCFARDMGQAMSHMSVNNIKHDPRVGRGIDMGKAIRLFEGKYNHTMPFLTWGIKNKRYIELGTLGEPFQEPDKVYRKTKNFFNLCNAYEIPLYINTKLNLVCRDENYFNMVAEHKAPIILSPTITTVRDDIAKIIEPLAPPPSDRLDTIKRLAKEGVPSIVYTSPFLPGITDSDLEEYVKELIAAKAVGLHLRNFYFVAKLHNHRYWREYYIKHKDLFKGYKLKSSVMLDGIRRIKEIAGNKLYVVGVKKQWFDVEPYYGKISFDHLSERFRKPVVDFSYIPILRYIRRNKDIPQILKWDNLGFDYDKINIPKEVRSDENGGLALITTTCTCLKRPIRRYYAKGDQWITASIWDGFEDRADGQITGLDRIYKISKDSKPYKKDGHYIYAYIPPALKEKYVKDGFVDFSLAKDFLEPVRPKDNSDKFYELNELAKL